MHALDRANREIVFKNTKQEKRTLKTWDTEYQGKLDMSLYNLDIRNPKAILEYTR
jgi:hypothetical protein